KGLGERMAALVEEAKANDPRELKRRIAELEGQLRERPAAEPRVERVEVPVLQNGQVAELRDVLTGLGQLAAQFGELAQGLNGALARAVRQPSPATSPRPSPTPR